MQFDCLSLVPHTRHFHLVAAAILATVLLSATSTQAELIGLSPANFNYNEADSGSSPIIGDNSIQLTTGPLQRRSIWFKTPQNITQGFTATFSYRASQIAASAPRQGLTFSLQNAPAGITALGTSFGYAGLDNSLAITFETDTGPARTYSGYYTDGALGGGSALTMPVNAFAAPEIDVQVSYNHLAGLLSVSMTQGANTFGPSDYLVGDLTAVLGGPTAYVGFTAGTNNGINQFISDFRFVPEPSSVVMLTMGSLAVGSAARIRRNRRK